jgi:hypothetical protein
MMMQARNSTSHFRADVLACGALLWRPEFRLSEGRGVVT